MTSRAAWGYGLATVAGDGTVLDTWFPSPSSARCPRRRPVHRAGRARGPHRARRAPRRRGRVRDRRDRPGCRPRLHPGRLPAPAPAQPPARRARTRSTSTASSRHLPIVVWTTAGPVHPDDFARLRPQPAARRASRAHGIDKFPRLLDYVTPARVRIADASRVRLGAHLAPGTTVMHEGFVNFNAGTLGASMVEGRISQGVVVGDGSDIGGGASIMGTLSGGGTERVVDRRARAARRELRHRHLDRRRHRRRGRALRDRRHEGARHRRWTASAP